ncbi:MAG: PAS domain S-box protein [Firmicutes bacterium]|nr:PAS domain S-box protein [Bacillota bacterium]
MSSSGREVKLYQDLEYNLAYFLPQVVFEANQEGRLVFANRNGFNVFGYNEVDFVEGMYLLDLIIPEDRERAQERIKLCLSGSPVNIGQYTILRKDGSTFPALVSSSPITDAEGKPAIVGVVVDITDYHQIQERLIISETQLQKQVSYLNTLIENMNEAFLTYDTQGRITFVNKKTCEYTGYHTSEMLGKSVLELIHPEKRGMVAEKVRQRIDSGPPDSYETIVMHKSGDIRIMLLNSSPILEDGVIQGGMVVAEDITERRKVEEALKQSEQRQADIINFLPDPTFAINLEGRVIAWNLAMEEMTGYRVEDMLGCGNYEYSLPFFETRQPMLADILINPDLEIKDRYNILKREKGVLVAEGESWIHHAGGGEKRSAYLWVIASLLYDSQGRIAGAIETIRDITERRKTEEQLRYLTLHDFLTGLYNRTFFEEEMRRLSCGRHRPVGLVICDVNGLKLVNDTRGHDSGDELLKAVAQVLRQSFRENDTVARIGGDEFAILMPSSPLSALENAVCRIKEAIARHNDQHSELPLSISIGYAATDESPPDMASLFKEADNQMYRQKLSNSRLARNALVNSLMNDVLEKLKNG